jgi:YbbR domain-containing protein
MAPMNRWKFITNNFAIKCLSLSIAIILWFTVTVDKETTKRFSVPIRVTNIPSGFAVVGNVPDTIEVTVAAPGILFLAHPVFGKPLTLDLRKTGKGTVAFPDLQSCIDVPYGMRVIMVYPSSIELKLEQRVESLSSVF